jgi:hypothetical protein
VKIKKISERNQIAKKNKKSMRASTILSIAVIGGASVSKVSQLYAIHESGSVHGLDMQMFASELFSQTVAVMYHAIHQFPVLAYAENIALGAQNLVILGYIAKLRKLKVWIAGYCVGIVIWIWMTKRGFEKMRKLLDFLQVISVPILFGSRIYQILVNYKKKSTGQLSAIPFLMNLIGSLARVFTTIQDLKGDKLVMLGFLSSIVLNATMILQIVQSNIRKKF